MKCKKLNNFEIGISSNLLLNITLLYLNITPAVLLKLFHSPLLKCMQHSEFNQIEIAPSKKMAVGVWAIVDRCSVPVISEMSITEHRIHKNCVDIFSGKWAAIAHIVYYATSNQALFCEVYFLQFVLNALSLTD